MKQLIIFFLLIIFFAVLSCGKENEAEKVFSSEDGGLSEAVAEETWPPPSIKDEVEVDLKRTGARNYYIIFDGSGSMAGEKIEIAKKAFVRFIKIIPDKSNIGLTSFDANGFHERAPLGSPKNKIIEEVNKIKAGGNTPLGSCIEIAYQKLGLQAKKQMGYGEYSLIILTDGQATDGNKMGYAVDQILRETPIAIHTIGLKIGTGHALNQPGRIYYKAAENFEELSKGLDSVLAETENFTVTDF
ncbi:MAG TPA: VWA domain-containing protein [Spirochaetota bacterium]|nr:VWA domain-containing protein [Spirochaetota bacterium]HPR36582.1 VWA domain-containing protein [Spirochaetota bacterium]HRX46276.1 VWA domain-containing protein [Spirochaetota bacterium]